MTSTPAVKNITVILGTPRHGCHHGPLLRAIDGDPQLGLDLILSGERTSPELDNRCCVMVSHGFSIRKRVELPRATNTPSELATLPTHQRLTFADALHVEPTDLVLLLGDPKEMLPAAQAAQGAEIPVAYLHDSATMLENRDGENDEHRELTEICHQHFVTNARDGQELATRGEEPQRIDVCGSPLVDDLQNCSQLRRDELAKRLGTPLDAAPLVITFNPHDCDSAELSRRLKNLFDAVDFMEMPTIFVYTEDMNVGSQTTEAIQSYTRERSYAHLARRCDWPAYWSLLREAVALVSDSAIGMVETSWLELPLIRVSEQEHDCPQANRIIYSNYEREYLFAAIATATAKEFPDLYERGTSSYGDGTSAQSMVVRLKNLVNGQGLPQKHRQKTGKITGTLPIGSVTEPALATSSPSLD